MMEELKFRTVAEIIAAGGWGRDEVIQPVNGDHPKFSTHKWWRSSGTTATCDGCGLIAFGETDKGWPISFPRRSVTFFNKDGNWAASTRECPECVGTAT